MAFLSKNTVLKAYEMLSEIDSEKQQGLTQKVSALKYVSALDIYYKNHNSNCDLKNQSNKDEFSSYVGDIVKINDELCTKDFYKSISSNGRDFDCGSNFFSSSSVKDSKTNPLVVFKYPKRSGWKPVMDIKDQILLYRADYLNDVFSYYLTDAQLRLAYIVWLLRFSDIENVDVISLKKELEKKYTSDFCDALFSVEIYNIDSSYIEMEDNPCCISKEDIFNIYDERDMYYYIQQIWYGAPGTGKSNEVYTLTKGKKVIRTTFHPDSDYSTFVGAYKPIMNNGKIEYRFVKQAFLKAYLLAWKLYCDGRSVNSNSASVIAPYPIPSGLGSTIWCPSSTKTGGKFTVRSVIKDKITIYKKTPLSKSLVLSSWNDAWKTGSFKIKKSPSGTTMQDVIATKINDLLGENSKKETFEKGWECLLKEIVDNGGQIKARAYDVSIDNDNKTLILGSEMTCTKKNIIGKPSGYAKDLSDMLKKISSDFDEAWSKLKESISSKATQIKDVSLFPIEQNSEDGNITDDTPVQEQETSDNASPVYEPVYLVIEEINRGNCAQIFGDIFQLLDRQENKFSSYPIEADTDIQQEIKSAFAEDEHYKLNGHISVDNVVDEYSSSFGNTLSKDIEEGNVLLLPPNLYIWATMNTSDQSLFPMDSAFKRRWDWEYVPIEEGKEKDKPTPLGWKIKLDENHELIDWWTFLERINRVVADLTTSEDKQLGYFFCKPDEKAENGEKTIISAKRFVNKVIFYLWNDVFKDYAFDVDCCKDSNKKEVLFYQFFNKNSNTINIDTLKQFFETLKTDKDDSLVVEKQNQNTPVTPTV